MKHAYIKGMAAAYDTVGLKQAGLRINSDNPKGTPYPSKNKSIQAERLADLLQKDDTEISRVSPDNTHRTHYNKPITWSAPVNLAGMDEGQPVAGIIAPANPRS